MLARDMADGDRPVWRPLIGWIACMDACTFGGRTPYRQAGPMHDVGGA